MPRSKKAIKRKLNRKVPTKKATSKINKNSVAAQRAWTIVSNILFAICLLFLAAAACLSFMARSDGKAVSIAGFQPYIIATASMEPTFAVNGLVVTHEQDYSKVSVGDVVAFKAAGLKGQTALHRVIAIDNTGENAEFIVKGDNNQHPDGALVTKENYVGRVVFNTNVTATFFDILHRPGGVFLAIILPLGVLCLIYFGSRWMIGSTNDWRSKGLLVCCIVLVVSASLLISYTMSTLKQIDATNTGLEKIAQDFTNSGADKSWTIDGKEVLGIIEIPKINLNYPIIPYKSATSLNTSITHFYGAALNQPGNSVLAGHRVFGKASPFNVFFTNIDKLNVGDEIFVTDASRSRQAYRVIDYKTVAPNDDSVLDQPADGKKYLTLISCSYDLKNRYIVTAVAP